MYFCNPYIYYMQKKEYQQLIKNIKDNLIKLQSSISVYAFGNIRGGMGIKKLEDLYVSSKYKSHITLLSCIMVRLDKGLPLNVFL